MNAAYQHRSLVLSLAIASYALVFMTFVVFEVPGLGIAHLFYLPIAALALMKPPSSLSLPRPVTLTPRSWQWERRE